MSPSKPAKRVQTAYLGLGSNLGDRHATLNAALAHLAAAPGVRLARLSPVYETAAVVLPGQAPQPDFLNAVVELETSLDAHALLDLCLAIEQHLGRVRRERWGARTLDLDVLHIADVALADDRLTLPHPRLTERAFVLAPFADLAPDLRLAGATLRDHLARADRTGVAPRPDLPLSPPVLLEEITLPAPPHEFFARLADRDHAFFLDSGLSSGGLGAYSFFGYEPFLVFRSKNNVHTLSSPGNPQSNLLGYSSALDALQHLLRAHRPPTKPICHVLRDKSSEPSSFQKLNVFERANFSLPFVGGAVGFLGYELCTQLEKLSRTKTDDLPAVPDCEFAFYDALIAHEHPTGRTWLVANPLGSTPAADLLARLHALLPASSDAPSERPLSQPTPQSICHVIRDKPAFPAADQPLPNFTPTTYSAAIDRIKAYIASGDVYQVNLTQRFSAPLPCAPYALYRRLRARSPAPFASFLNFDPVQIVSSSPERFLTLRGRHVETRPIKGTRPRSANPATDAALATELQASEKDRAELLMIIDLERNDLGRVCDYGSVRVDKLFRLESHPTVHHLVSTVTGTLRAGLDIVDLIRATFPGGSITGAPKIRAMEIIDELEPHRRHVYTGAIGYIGFDGDADLNIAIRTITCVGHRAHYHVGGGVVWDSSPEAEYQETLDKGRAMHDALTS